MGPDSPRGHSGRPVGRGRKGVDELGPRCHRALPPLAMSWILVGLEMTFGLLGWCPSERKGPQPSLGLS